MIANYNSVPKIHVSDRLCKINSCMIAFVLMAEYIAIILGSLFHLTNILPIIFVTAVTISYVSAFFAGFALRININVLLFYVYSLFLIAFSMFFNGAGTNITYLSDFLSYGMIGFLLLILPYEPRIILRFISCSAIAYLIFPSQILEFISTDTATYGQINMFSSYAISTIIVSSIIYLFFYTKSFKWFDIIVYIANLSLLFLVLLQGSRGAVIELFVLFLFIWWKKSGSNDMRKDFLKKYLFLAGILFTGIVIITNYALLLKMIYESLRSMGISISLINKSYTLIASQGSVFGVLNGRDTVFANALSLFVKSPVFGTGAGSFGDAFGTWPHNLILQLLSELGILFSIPFLYVIGRGIFAILRQWKFAESKDAGIMLLFLFSISIPRLMLSAYFWKEQSFWMFIIVTCSFIHYKKGLQTKGTGEFSINEQT